MLLIKENLTGFLQALARQGNLLLPTEADGVSKFAPYVPGLAADLALVNTTLPPKEALLSATEKLYRYHEMVGELELAEAVLAKPQIIFGIRPCDVQAIACLDEVFLRGPYADALYATKRQQLILVAVGCVKASAGCFCTTMGLNPAAAPGADMLLLPTEDGWNVEGQTSKGQAFADDLRQSGLLAEGEAPPLPAAVCSIQANISGLPQKLAHMLTHPLWEEIHQGCVGCGVCTYLCPTCYCFGIGHQAGEAGGDVFRCWDSCMFAEYSRMAGGDDSRPSKEERLRNRYLHKLYYFYQRYGKHLCVGCGRCLNHCPARLDMVTLIERAGEEQL